LGEKQKTIGFFDQTQFLSALACSEMIGKFLRQYWGPP